ncbi:hypothetical protein H7F13_08135 [Proteus vulgaris]|nr:hypothetical protein H7F13_08135 [Proteus vulgaris]
MKLQVPSYIPYITERSSSSNSWNATALVSSTGNDYREQYCKIDFKNKLGCITFSIL